MNKLNIFTDGSCLKNPGPGGYGIIVIINNKIYKFSNGYYFTTNNRMELIAVIIAIRKVNNINILININTDSLYVKLGITLWIINWKKNKWKLSNNMKVKNIDLWKELDYLNNINNINWNWIKGHSNNIYNNECDKLAKLASLNPTLIDNEYLKNI